ncbi:hypothetical protein AGABI2DRAFT_190197 [Agaricus bisporus var. bisporus H97]|uniref:hypothetical protein n=1 Tax=Agaricus bisporus var. bisporus (strain H97 / ATCC MYA-4626 / FGSC 10389) TaxID=936046 RepID=UPI00029F56A9|nr:hypothetical protein AGABI2DRAFT_190197 [Agaricus bisporus var. bisporus H97]EKV49728.1 hypothetical protein AGABI2DRAFT_190197 [Agaricus bisporus var. bisporus H97]
MSWGLRVLGYRARDPQAVRSKLERSRVTPKRRAPTQPTRSGESSPPKRGVWSVNRLKGRLPTWSQTLSCQ